MKRAGHRWGGFAALNSGTISDCYCATVVRGGAGVKPGGFCGENTGRLLRCFARGRVSGSGERGGFSAHQNGTAEDCFWLRGDQADDGHWLDWDRAVRTEELRGGLLDGWDLDGLWRLGEGGELSLYDVPAPERSFDRVVEIGDRRQLLDFAREVNEGTAQAGTLYRLTADIDLGGRQWTPVGPDQNQPFQGCFDGCGHEVRNFCINTNKHPLAGLFGCVGEGSDVRNLRVDCVLLGRGSSAAPLCAVNEGEITNCTACAHGDRARYAGGLVAQNRGHIARCAAFGRVGGKHPVAWWAAALLLLLLCLPMPVYFALTAQAEGAEVFAPVILDPNAEPVEADEEFTPAPDEVTDTSASFIMNAEMYVGTENYAGAAGLRCPSWSTRGFVATVRVTAEDLARAGYELGEEYAVLYQSGLIAPGYGVDVITLGSLPDGSKLPVGEYELSVLLEFYDVQTNEKSAVNTVVPLETTVG